MQTALSITVHEAPETIIDQCLNNVIVGEFDWIALHINQISTIDPDDLQRRIDTVERLRGRVFINPQRFITNWCEPGLLHRAHISNFRLLRNTCHFSSFAMDGSNSLLVRKGLKAHMASHAYGTDSVSAFGWSSTWEDNLRQDFLFDMVGDACRRAHIEGLFMRTAIFDEVAQWCDGYDARYEDAVRTGVQPLGLPREEYLFVTALDQLGYQPQGTNYVMIRHASNTGWFIRGSEEQEWQWVNLLAQTGGFSWEEFEIRRSLEANRILPFFWELIGDHIAPIRDLPAYQADKFAVKRVSRELDNPVRKMIGEHFAYADDARACERAFAVPE